MTILITPLPTPPTRQDSLNFNDRADEFLGALPLFQQEANALAVDVQSSANEVEITRQVVASIANVTKWISGTTYAEGAAVWSPINGVTYRKITGTIGGTTDPSLDGINYKSITDAAGVTYIPAGPVAVPTTVQSKLREIVSLADAGGTAKELIRFKAGGATSDTVIVNSSINDAKDNLSAASINGGGSAGDENYIGFGKNRSTFSTTGTAFTWPYLPTGNDLTNLRLFKLSAFNVQTGLTSPSGYTAVINGSQVDITLAVALTSGERLIVEDRAAKVEDAGTAPSYGWIGGGYDNIILNGVMQHVTGAHHRVLGGDHGSIFGGSYGIIGGGSYGFIGGGTNNEIGSSGGVASAVVGGLRNLVNGGTGTIVGGQENKVTGSQSAIVGGTRNSVSGTASFAVGRNNTVVGSDNIVAGNGSSVSASYSAVFGYQHSMTSAGSYSFVAGDRNICNGLYSIALGSQNTVSHDYSAIRGGRNGATSWSGQDIRWAYRPSGGQLRSHFFLDAYRFTTGTTPTLLALLDGTTTGIAIPISSIWKCRLQLTAQGSNGACAIFELVFATKRGSSGSASFIGTPSTVLSTVEAGLGAGATAAAVSVAIVSDAVEITLTPRSDLAVSTRWAAVLEIVESKA